MVCTYYYQPGSLLADGTYYKHSGYFCAAPKSYKLGSTITIVNKKTGKHIRLRVRDRCSHIDISRAAAKRLFGSRYKVIGRYTVKVYK